MWYLWQCIIICIAYRHVARRVTICNYNHFKFFMVIFVAMHNMHRDNDSDDNGADDGDGGDDDDDGNDGVVVRVKLAPPLHL